MQKNKDKQTNKQKETFLDPVSIFTTIFEVAGVKTNFLYECKDISVCQDKNNSYKTFYSWLPKAITALKKVAVTIFKW